jgi:hypothetical protein
LHTYARGRESENPARLVASPWNSRTWSHEYKVIIVRLPQETTFFRTGYNKISDRSNCIAEPKILKGRVSKRGKRGPYMTKKRRRAEMLRANQEETISVALGRPQNTIGTTEQEQDVPGTRQRLVAMLLKILEGEAAEHMV